jgi:hypothetical protein
MTIKTSLLSILLGTAIAASATAQETTPVDLATLDLGQRMASSYANMSAEYFEDLLAPDQMYRLFLLTKQEVVSLACEGFTLDQDQLRTSLNAIMATQPMDDGQPNALIFGRIMHGYGIVKGGEMAPATFDPDAYCTYRQDIIAELSGSAVEGELLVLRMDE